MSEQKQEESKGTEGGTSADEQQEKSERPDGRSGTAQASSSMDQIGDIAKGVLDLAGAGLSLGFKVIDKFGGMATDIITEKIIGGAGQTEQPYEPKPEMHADQDQPYQQPEETSADKASEVLWVVNRIPAYAGSEVKVSFSFSNESAELPKKITLAVGSFTGEGSGHSIDVGLLTIKPKSKTIAPMDFDKFVLIGNIPEGTPADKYYGWIVVSAENEIKVPARLEISAKTEQ